MSDLLADIFPKSKKRQEELYGSVMVEQTGKDCRVTMRGQTRIIKNCDALKFSRSLWNKAGEKYSQSEMSRFGFELKKVKSIA